MNLDDVEADFEAWVAELPPAPGSVHTVDGEIAEIILDHPATRNALSPQMMVALGQAVERLVHAPTTRVILLRGAGGHFCSGGNLDAVRDSLGQAGRGRIMGAYMQRVGATLFRGPVPVLGVLTGAALGGGAELLTACQEVFAAHDARVGFVQARLGVSTGFGGGSRLVERIGAHRALRVLTEARLINAEDAYGIGLIDTVCADPLAAARARAAALVALAPEVVAGLRRLVREAARPEVEDVELSVFDALWGGPAHRAALANKPRG